MPQEMAVIIFKAIWGILLLVAVSAQMKFKGRLIRKGGVLAVFLVVAPYLVVFGWFSVRDYVGSFKADIVTQVAGMVIAVLGMAGYIASILYLRRNWSVSAAIKEGHALVKGGPYRYVRHPMYFSMILVVLGTGLVISNFLIILYSPAVVWLYYLRARKEEAMLKNALPEYEQYIKKTKMLIPGIF